MSMAEHMSQTHAAFRETDMSVVKEERYVFKVDWFDKQAALIRNYLLTFYPSDASAEMVSDVALLHFFEIKVTAGGVQIKTNPLFKLVRPKKQKDLHEEDAVPRALGPGALPWLHCERARQAAQAGGLC